MEYNKSNVKGNLNMDLTEEIKESIIYYALNNLLNNLKDSDINNLIEYTPLQSLSAEEIIDLIEMTMADQ